MTWSGYLLSIPFGRRQRILRIVPPFWMPYPLDDPPVETPTHQHNALRSKSKQPRSGFPKSSVVVPPSSLNKNAEVNRDSPAASGVERGGTRCTTWPHRVR